VDLIDQVEDDADPLIVDAKVLLQVLNEVRPRDVGVGELLSGRVLARNQPFFFDSYLQRFDFKAGADQELLPIDHSPLHPSARIFCFSGGPIRHERLKLRIDLVREHNL
jgi:hypothetical protein